MPKPIKVDFTIEAECNGKTIEYEVRAKWHPGSPGKTYGPPENCYPPEPPEVTEVMVYYVSTKTCRNCVGTGVEGGNDKPTKTCTKCLGRKVIKTEEERPELVDCISDDDVERNVPEPDEPDSDPD